MNDEQQHEIERRALGLMLLLADNLGLRPSDFRGGAMMFHGWLCGVLRRELSVSRRDVLKNVLAERRRQEAAKLGERNLGSALSLLLFRRSGEPIADARTCQAIVAWLKEARRLRERREQAERTLAKLDAEEASLGQRAEEHLR